MLRLEIELPNLDARTDQMSLRFNVMARQADFLPHVLQHEKDAPVVLRADAKMQHHLIHVPQLGTRVRFKTR